MNHGNKCSCTKRETTQTISNLLDRTTKHPRSMTHGHIIGTHSEGSSGATGGGVDTGYITRRDYLCGPFSKFPIADCDCGENRSSLPSIARGSRKEHSTCGEPDFNVPNEPHNANPTCGRTIGTCHGGPRRMTGTGGQWGVGRLVWEGEGWGGGRQTPLSEGGEGP